MMDVQLVMFKEDGTRRDFDVKRNVSILGRAGDCDFHIPLAIISRRHCQITRKDNRLMIKDLGSSNGTYVNNKRVLQTQLHAGDTLTLGPVVFTVIIDGKPEDVKPVKTILTETTDTSVLSSEPLISDSGNSDSGIPMAASATGSALDLGGLDNIAIADDEPLGGPDDSALPSPLAELEALAKQQKK